MLLLLMCTERNVIIHMSAFSVRQDILLEAFMCLFTVDKVRNTDDRVGKRHARKRLQVGLESRLPKYKVAAQPSCAKAFSLIFLMENIS